jgi:hypothetical protein
MNWTWPAAFGGLTVAVKVTLLPEAAELLGLAANVVAVLV